jgi:hypothetical protein
MPMAKEGAGCASGGVTQPVVDYSLQVDHANKAAGSGKH